MKPDNPYLPVPNSQLPDDDIDVVGYLDVLLANRWLIAGVTGLVLALGIAYAFLAPPVYEADILVQVEDNPNSADSLLGNVSALFDIKTQATAEIEILRSRLIVGKAVDNLQLYISAKPKYFPVIGQVIARNSKGLSEPGLLGLGGYAWAKEDIKVQVFDVPDDFEDEKFTLTVLGSGEYILDQKGLDQPIKGKIGQMLEATQSIGKIRLLVSDVKAKPGITFRLVRSSRLRTLGDLQDDLKIEEKGKQSGIIGASLRGKDPVLTSAIMNEIGQEYVAQNVKRKAAEAEKSLVFLEGLLPQLKRELEQSEYKYNQMRDRRGTFNLTEEGKAYLQESVTTQAGLLELKQKRADLITRFAPGHPALQAVEQQIAALTTKANSIDGRVKTLPSVEQDTLRLLRDVQVNNDLYVGLLNNIQQLKLVKAGKVGNVRLVDGSPVPEEPVKPKKPLVIIIAAMLGMLIGVLIAFVRDALYGGITDSQDIEEHTGLNVYATVPLSPLQGSLASELQSRKRGRYLLAEHAPNDLSIESLRSLRTALQFAMLDSDNNRLLVTGPTPGVGKSFVSANLAAVMAVAGKRVLLIDADMRKGYLNQYFGKDRGPGLSDVLARRATLDEVTFKSVMDGLDFIGTGTLPPNPAELLMSERMQALLDEISSRYDLVIVDTPPVLAVADTGILAPKCGTVFLVTRFEKSTIGEVSECAKILSQVGRQIKGVIFNGLDPNAFRYGYGSKYGRYRYAYYGYNSDQSASS